MKKTLAILATYFFFLVITLPSSAEAAQSTAVGFKNTDQYEFSASSRQRRHAKPYYRQNRSVPVHDCVARDPPNHYVDSPYRYYGPRFFWGM
jgi:hypothetical protein